VTFLVRILAQVPDIVAPYRPSELPDQRRMATAEANLSGADLLEPGIIFEKYRNGVRLAFRRVVLQPKQMGAIGRFGDLEERIHLR
jgi:hypothetical protein